MPVATSGAAEKGAVVRYTVVVPCAGALGLVVNWTEPGPGGSRVPTVVRRKPAADEVASAVAVVDVGDVVEAINGENAAMLARDAFISRMQTRPLELEFCRAVPGLRDTTGPV